MCGVVQLPLYTELRDVPVVICSFDRHINRVIIDYTSTAIQAYNGQMSDQDLSAVITYERNAWGNNTGTMV